MRNTTKARLALGSKTLGKQVSARNDWSGAAVAHPWMLEEKEGAEAEET